MIINKIYKKFWIYTFLASTCSTQVKSPSPGQPPAGQSSRSVIAVNNYHYNLMRFFWMKFWTCTEHCFSELCKFSAILLTARILRTDILSERTALYVRSSNWRIVLWQWTRCYLEPVACLVSTGYLWNPTGLHRWIKWFCELPSLHLECSFGGAGCLVFPWFALCQIYKTTGGWVQALQKKNFPEHRPGISSSDIARLSRNADRS